LVLSANERAVKSQQRSGPDGDGDFQDALRRHEYRTQSEQDAVKGPQLRGPFSRSIQNQQLVLQENRFGGDRTGTTGGDDPDDRDDQVSKQDEPIAHAANDDPGGGLSQDYKPGSKCGRLSIRHGHVDSPDLRPLLRGT
jgi:hypothetical protein